MRLDHDGAGVESLRVLLVARRSAPARGGVESYMRHVSRGLAKQHQVTLLAQRIDEGASTRLTDSLRPPPTFEPFDDEGVEVTPLRFSGVQRLRMLPTIGQVIPGLRRYAYGRLRVPMAGAYVSAAAPTIARLAAEHDVVHVWADGFLALAGVRAAKSLGRPVLVTPFVHRRQWGDDIVSANAYRRADRVIGLLQTDCAVLQELGAAPERVVECGVCSPGVKRGGGARWRHEHGVEGPLVVFLGVRRPYKGFDVLRAALPEFGRRIPGATVVFAGPGDPVPPSDSPRVIDRGPVSDDERAALLEAADVYCLPSAGEIYPVTILEAWSAETAVVTSNIPPLAELMRRSGGGVAAPREPEAVASAIASVLTGSATEMGSAGHRFWQETATVEAVVERHVGLYREVIAQRARASS